MKGLNKAFLIGHIGQDPELRTTSTGKHILKLSLATPNPRKVDDAWIDIPDWHRVTAWDRDAQYLARYARKGDLLAVQCTIRPSKWTDKDNVVRYSVDLYVDDVLSLNGKARLGGVRAEALPDPAEDAARVEDDVEGVPF